MGFCLFWQGVVNFFGGDVFLYVVFFSLVLSESLEYG